MDGWMFAEANSFFPPNQFTRDYNKKLCRLQPSCPQGSRIFLCSSFQGIPAKSIQDFAAGTSTTNTMKLKNCCITHFIRTISNGLVSRVKNIDYHGRPMIKLKSLKDVYENENAENLRSYSSSLLFDDKKVKCENACLPVANRTLEDVKHNLDEFIPADYENHVDSDLDDDTTLEHVKKHFLSRKRKLTWSSENSVQDSPNGFTEGDESDLDEPLINLKRKNMKIFKGKRKLVNMSSASEIGNFASQSKENLVSEGSLQVDNELTPVISVKLEIPDAKISGFQSKTLLADDSYAGSSKFKYPCGIASDVDQKISHNENSEQLFCQYENYVAGISDEDLVDIESICSFIPWEEMSIKVEVLGCEDLLYLPALAIPERKKVRYTHSSTSLFHSHSNSDICGQSKSSSNIQEIPDEDWRILNQQILLNPATMLISRPCDKMMAKLEAPELVSENFLYLPDLAASERKMIKDAHSCRSSHCFYPNSGISGQLRSSSVEEISEHGSSSRMQQFHHRATDSIIVSFGFHQELISILAEYKSVPQFFHHLYDSLSINNKKGGYYPYSFVFFNTEDDLRSTGDTSADKGLPSSSSFNGILKDDGFCAAVHMEHQLSASRITDSKSLSCLKTRTFYNADMVPNLEIHQGPERLKSTRKVPSPSSEERLHLMMNSLNLRNDTDHHKQKLKLIEKENIKKALIVKSDVRDNTNVRHGQRRHVSEQRDPKRIIRKSNVAKGKTECRGSSCTVPQISTGCTSCRVFSESVIQFSKKQMHGMESLVANLTNELKCMKDMVEQKLLFEAYRNPVFKNCVSEVKSAINKAVKVEEKSKKQLSLLTADCARFCKIMKMTRTNPSYSEDTHTVSRKRRKIVFADEAGEKLCHVKVFDVCEPSPDAM